MFTKGNPYGKLSHTKQGAQTPQTLAYWFKRLKVDINKLSAIERADLALKAWTISVKLPTKATDRATRTDDAQRLIKALEGDSRTPQAVQAQEGPVVAATSDTGDSGQPPIAHRDGVEPRAIPTVGE